jgi:hypothetical protein
VELLSWFRKVDQVDLLRAGDSAAFSDSKTNTSIYSGGRKQTSSKAAE